MQDQIIFRIRNIASRLLRSRTGGLQSSRHGRFMKLNKLVAADVRRLIFQEAKDQSLLTSAATDFEFSPSSRSALAICVALSLGAALVPRIFCAESNVASGELRYEEPRNLTGAIYSAGAEPKRLLFKFQRVATRSGSVLNVLRDYTPSMGAEDFAFMLQAKPGCYVLIGNGESASLHNSRYDFNDEALPLGASYWARLVERVLA